MDRRGINPPLRQDRAAQRRALEADRRRRAKTRLLGTLEWLELVRDEIDAELARDQDQGRANRRRAWLDAQLRERGTEAQRMLQAAADRRDEPRTIALRLAFLAAKHD